MARTYRRHPDSSYLTSPRVFARVFPDPGTLVETVRFYEGLTGVALDMDTDIPEAGLRVVAVGAFLILELSSDEHGLARETTVTVLSADLDATVRGALQTGAEVVQERWDSPNGPGMRLRHPDGTLVEYLEHRPGKDDVGEPGPEFR